MIGRLAEQERMRQDFLANASHELKTPTMAIGSVVEALRAGAAEDPLMRRQFLNSLEKLVERQFSLLQDLLDITRLDGRSDTAGKHETVTVQQLILDTMEQVKDQAEKKKINLTMQWLADSDDNNKQAGISVLGNYLQLQRALINVLTNAINYTPEEGLIKITVNIVEHEQIQIRIEDTGPGIDSADLPYIFDRFYRADKARSRASGGTGLGTGYHP